MNRRFRRRLQPGERILLRSTEGTTAWYLAAGVVVLFVAAWLRNIGDVPFLGFKFWNATLFMLFFTVPAPILAWLWTSWKWVITDRRVLKAYGPFSSEIGAMRHEAVETVRLDDRKLVVNGSAQGWDLPINPNFFQAETLHRLYGDRFVDPGLPAKPVGEMLEAGETLLWRYSPLVTELLPWAVLLSGPVLLFAELAWMDALASWYFNPIILIGPYAVLLGNIVAAWRRRGWQAVLTDRRLLIRRPHWPARCDAVPLDAVTEAYWDSKGWELVVVSPGRTDTIFCLPWTARRLLAALERNDRGEALA